MAGIQTDNGVNSTVADEYISLSEPLILFMFVTKVFSINVTLPCSEIGLEYEVTFSSKTDDTFGIGGNSKEFLTCIENESNSTMLSSYSNVTGIIQDNIRISLRGNLLGISELVIVVKSPCSRRADLFDCDISHSNNTYDITKENTEQYLDVSSKESHSKMADTPFPVSVNGSMRLEKRFPVTVLRNLRPIDKIFMYLVTVFLFIVTMGFGCKLDLGIVKECLKKPVAPGIGFGCQYLLMPLLGFAIAKLLPLDVDRNVALGIFVCGVCPGGGISNIYTYLLDGDVSLSITMTFLSTVASIGMMPLWIYTLGRLIMDENYHVSIPYVNMVQIIALITVPLFIGIVIKYKFLKVALTILKILKPVTVIAILLFMVIGLYSNWFIFKLFRPLHIIVGCLLPYIGYILGGGIAAILKQPFYRVKTIALETGMQNVGVAYLLMISSFPPPHGDLASVAPMASALMTPFPPFIVTVIYLIYKKCCKDYELVDIDEPEIKVSVSGQGRSDDSEQIVEKMSVEYKLSPTRYL